MAIKIKYVIGVFLLLVGVSAFSQTDSNTTTSFKPNNDLKTPYNSIWAHLHFSSPENYKPKEAGKPFLLANEKNEAKELASKLIQIYDWKGLKIDLKKVPTDTFHMDSISNKFIFYPFKSDLPNIYITRIDDNWVYAEESLDRIESLHEEMGFLKHTVQEMLPKNGHEEFLYLEIWQWVSLSIILVIFFVLHFFLTKILHPLLKKYILRILHKDSDNKKYITRLTKLLSYLILIQFLRLVLPMLQLGLSISEKVTTTFNITSAILILFIGLQLINVVVQLFLNYTERTDNSMDNQLVPLLDKFIKVVLISLALIHILNLAGVNTTALLAGVSIGGLAIALAAQETVKNLLGSAMIFMDKPFKIGDLIKGPHFMGIVAEVGFRSTRIRTSDSTIITIPNGIVANSTINNLGVRSFRLYKVSLKMNFATSKAQIEALKVELKTYTDSLPEMLHAKVNFLFTEINESYLEIMCKFPIDTSSYPKELEIKEAINFKIVELLDKLEIKLYMPSNTIFLEQ